MDDARSLRDVDRDAVAKYALGQQTRSGGFSFYAYSAWGVDEPHVADTYAAIAILRILDVPVPRFEACRAWLLHEQDPSGGYPMLGIAYSAFKALQLLGAHPLYDPRGYLQRSAQALGLADPPTLNLAGKAERVLQCLKLWHACDIPIGAAMTGVVRDAVAQLRGQDGGYGTPGANVVETAAAMELCNIVGLPLDPEALGYVQRCEKPPFGIDITPSSVSSSLECLHAGLRILYRFGVASKYPAAICRYVHSCRTGMGGFGRAPGAITRLDDTLRALQILSLVQGRCPPEGNAWPDPMLARDSPPAMTGATTRRYRPGRKLVGSGTPSMSRYVRVPPGCRSLGP